VEVRPAREEKAVGTKRRVARRPKLYQTLRLLALERQRRLAEARCYIGQAFLQVGRLRPAQRKVASGVARQARRNERACSFTGKR